MAIKPLRSHKPNLFFLSISAILVFLGLIFLASSSAPLGQIKFNDPYYFLKHQIIVGLIPGIIGFFLGYSIYYRRLIKWSFFLFLGSLILLMLVFTPLGIKKKGAVRWLNLGGFSFQPSELAKLTFIIYISSWLESKKLKGFLKGYLPFLIVIAALGILLIKEPATSMAFLIISTGIILYFLNKGKFSYILLTILLGGILFAYSMVSSPYKHHRLEVFLNPESDPYGYGYQIKQNIIAFGSGGFFGRGLGRSLLKEKLIPEAVGDSIFAVVGEETGFIGSVIITTLYLILLFTGLKIANNSPDMLSKLLVSGFSIVIALQALINIFAITKIIPFTGLPLPFISYGGTSLAVSLTMIGIIANVSKYTKA